MVRGLGVNIVSSGQARVCDGGVGVGVKRGISCTCDGKVFNDSLGRDCATVITHQRMLQMINRRLGALEATVAWGMEMDPQAVGSSTVPGGVCSNGTPRH